MNYIIKNDNDCYVKLNEHGGVNFTQNKKKATVMSKKQAETVMRKAPGKLKSYHIEISECPTITDNKRHIINSDIKQRIYIQQNGLCAYCGQYVVFSKMTIDHIIPLSKGGLNEESNYQCVCYQCNQAKGQMLEDEFFAWIANIYNNRCLSGIKCKTYSPSLENSKEDILINTIENIPIESPIPEKTICSIPTKKSNWFKSLFLQIFKKEERNE